MGVTRGHLLSVVLSVPLDVPGSPDELQVAAEHLLERALGDAFLDRWVASIDVDRIARRSGLVLAADGRAAASNYDVLVALSLVERGALAILAERPATLLSGPSPSWTALELSEAPELEQGDRTEASSAHPEALKAALEGLPFDSGRFTAGREVFAFAAWQAPSAERLSTRRRVEATLERLAETTASVRLAGTGFGRRRDFVDLWILPELEVVRVVGEALADAVGGEVAFGFYDTAWADERLVFA